MFETYVPDEWLDEHGQLLPEDEILNLVRWKLLAEVAEGLQRLVEDGTA